MLIAQLNEAVKVITELVKKDEYSHMRKPWEMVIGGLIVPAMIGVDKTLEENPKYKQLQDKYTRDKLESFFNPKPQKVRVSGDAKFRRLKDKVNKKSRFERELGTRDRDKLVLWWNRHQKLVSKDDPVCVALAQELNSEQPSLPPIAPLQLAGYFSHLCRMGMRTEKTRNARFEAAIKRGAMTVFPVYSPELLDAVRKNYNKSKEEEAQRAKDHAELARRRAAGDMTPMMVETEPADFHLDHPEATQATPPEPEPEPEVTDEFDIRYNI